MISFAMSKRYIYSLKTIYLRFKNMALYSPNYAIFEAKVMSYESHEPRYFTPRCYIFEDFKK